MRLALILLLSLLLVGCGRVSDTTVLKNLPGTWHVALSAKHVSTFVIASNGDFTCRSVVPMLTNTIPLELAGTFEVKDGFLIETVTNSTQPWVQGHIPFITRAKIIRADAHQMVITFDGTNQFSLQKETP